MISSDFSYSSSTYSLAKDFGCNCGSCELCLQKLKNRDERELNNLSDSERKEVERLKRREQEVITHEQAHVAAGANSPSYTYTMGPDNRKYVTGGEAKIDVGKGSTPEQTIEKMKRVIKAALAPSNPSSTDRDVAAKAQKMMDEARTEQQNEKFEVREDSNSSPIDSEQRSNNLKSRNLYQSMDSFYKGNLFDRVG